MKIEKIQNIALALAGLVSMAAAGAFTLGFAWLLTILASQMLVPVAFGQTTAGVQLEGAIAKEQVDGDLKSAIAAYQKIAKDPSAPREVRAKALLHLAGCYEKLGQQAQDVYQQIVRDFADQPAATQARARLAALKQNDRPAAPATMTQRKIETVDRLMGPGDTDGHRAVYLNRANEELIYDDFSGKSKRVIFKVKPDTGVGWFPSRDFSIVGLTFPSPDQRQILAVIKPDGTGYREIARIDVQSGFGNWSWDNRYILLCGESQSGTSRLLRISAADGQMRELLSLKAGKVSAATFSPDGRFIAYQVASSPADPASRIFVLPAEGGESQLIYEERGRPALRLLDCTADGRYLAISSERTGKKALYLLPIRDGKSAGSPVFVKYGDFEGGATTAAGGLIYWSVKPGGFWSVHVASLDADGRPGNWQRLNLPLGNIYNPSPEWSPDSNQIVYMARDEEQSGGSVVHLHDLSTGEDRKIHHFLAGYNTECAWAVRQLFCMNEDGIRNTDILSISVDSGQIERLHTFTGSRRMLVTLSRDARALYMSEILEGANYELLRWEIATGEETKLQQITESAGLTLVSPDERWLTRWNGKKHILEIRPLSGGDWRTLVSNVAPTGHWNTTPDGNWVFYHGIDSAGKHSLFRVATAAGGQPERLGDFPTNSGAGTLEISPDGSKIIVAAGEYDNGYELWSLENFVPAAPKR